MEMWPFNYDCAPVWVCKCLFIDLQTIKHNFKLTLQNFFILQTEGLTNHPYMENLTCDTLLVEGGGESVGPCKMA